MTQLPPPLYPLGHASNLPPPIIRPTAVSVIAIIGIVYASIGILGDLCTIPQSIGLQFMPNPVIGAMQADHVVAGYMIGSMIVDFILALVLLFSSIGLLSLRRRSRTVLLCYAVAYAAFIIIGQFVSTLIMKPRTQRVAEAALQSYSMFNTQMVKMMIQFGQIFGVCFGLVLLIWPAAILYLMTRGDVKAAFAKPANKI